MSAEVEPPAFTSMVQPKLQHHGWPEVTDVDFTDVGLDLAELQNLSGFLMNEAPDNTGHFYPPFTKDPDTFIRDRPTVVPDASGRTSGVQPSVAPMANLVAPDSPSVSFAGINPPGNAMAAGSSSRKSSGAGATRRRSSSKEEQAKKRRERNRVLARRTRLRKKFFFQSLQQQVAGLQRENERLKSIITTRCPDISEEIFLNCVAHGSTVVADSNNPATSLLDQSGFLLVKALQSSQPSFCVTDPQLPDNPIVYASDNFIALTGYERRQVLGRNCRFLQGPDTDPSAVAKIRKGIEEGVDTSVHLRQYKADGTVFWNHVFVAALRNSEHKIINYVGIQHALDKEPSPQVVACINSGDDEPTDPDEGQPGVWCDWSKPTNMAHWQPPAEAGAVDVHAQLDASS